MKPTENTALLLDQCLFESALPDRPADYRGKVRDIYHLSGDRLAIVATDRISAFDHIFAEPVPYKGQLLNLLARHGFEQTRGICANHLLSMPHPNVMITRRCSALPVEVVVRGYLSGHAYRVYKAGGRELCGVALPEGMREHEAFAEPVITPSTKAHEGHDEDISEQEILDKGLVSPPVWEQIKTVALALYRRGAAQAAEQGLLLVDTKYEFGTWNNELYVIDEVHTTDSSRFFYADEYAKRLAEGLPQRQLSKEFLREWLIETGHHAHLDERLPVLPDELRIGVYQRYRELYETITGKLFEPVDMRHFQRDLQQILNQYA